MKILANILGMLAFRVQSLRIQSGRRAIAGGAVCFSIGFLVYSVLRNLVYAYLPELSGIEGSFLSLNLSQVFLELVQSLLFLLIVYIPALILLSNVVSGDGLGLSFSKREYQTHASALLPLWGFLILIASPLQLLIPQFIPIGVFDISFGKLFRMILLCIYTLWAIKQLNYLSWAQSFGVFVLSWFAFAILLVLNSLFVALPFFILIPLFYLVWQRLRDYFASHANDRVFQENLHVLTLNPQDADAHYQLGLIHFRRGNWEAARRYFENSLKIDPGNPDCHYYIGRTYEFNEEWPSALEHYEETYRLNPEYGLRDIFREVGKAYLHTGNIEKGQEFLNSFLEQRGSDPEGRYWLAVALQTLGDLDQMRFQLNMIQEQARSNPRFFRKERREWIYRARNMIRSVRIPEGHSSE
jgi:tetratricopeptide (TPR) repeat protein